MFVRVVRFAFIVGSALATPVVASAAPQTIAYEYDDLGRLIEAVYDGSVAVIYEYDPSGNITRIDVGPPSTDVPPAPGEAVVPTVFAAHPGTPNPFTESTRILYQLPTAARVSLRIYDPAGRRVRSLVDEDRIAGFHAITWDGRDDRGQGVACGIYFYRFDAGGHREVQEIIRLK